MKMVRCLTHAAVVLACCGLIMPRAALAAGPAGPSNDVALSADGTLAGTLVTSDGQPLDGAVVSIRRGGTEVSRVISTAQGTFSVAGLSSGAYEIHVGQEVVPVRAWSATAAPPGARDQTVIVVGDAARAQMMGLDIITLWTLTASTGALILAALNKSDLNKIKNRLDQIVSP